MKGGKVDMSMQQKAMYDIAPAAANCLALAEIEEFSRRALHLDFAQAKRQAIFTALMRAAALSGDANPPTKIIDFKL